MPTTTSEHNDDCCLAVAGKLCAHHAVGVLPQLKEPWWYRQVKTGDAHRSDEAPEQVRRRQRHEREQKKQSADKRRARPAPTARLAHALTGGFVINRRKAA